MSCRASETEAGDGQSDEKSGHAVAWSGGEPGCHAENPGCETHPRSSNEGQGEEADSLVEEMISVVGDRARIFAHENASYDKEKCWIRERPQKANRRPGNLSHVPENPPL